MSRLYFILAALFILSGLLASLFAPFDGMGLREMFLARLLLLAPPVFVGTVISALAVIMQRLDRLISLQKPAAPPGKAGTPSLPESANRPAEEKDYPAAEEKTDFDSFFAATLREEREVQDRTPAAASLWKEEALFQEPDKTGTGPLAPTVDEFLEKAQEAGDTDTVYQATLVREGTFAGRSYRMYEDGSLEIDTDQSTIRFDSLDEFRSFVSSVASNNET